MEPPRRGGGLSGTNGEAVDGGSTTLDLVEVMNLAGALIAHHRVYWGRVGFRTLVGAAHPTG